MASIPTVSDCVTYLGAVAKKLEEPEDSGLYPQITQTLASETALQANKCKWGDVYPDALRMALLRRVQRALSAKQSPLGVATDNSSGISTFIPRWDSEITRMEAPYRKLVIG